MSREFPSCCKHSAETVCPVRECYWHMDDSVSATTQSKPLEEWKLTCFLKRENECMSLEEISDVLGTTLQRVREVEQHALTLFLASARLYSPKLSELLEGANGVKWRVSSRKCMNFSRCGNNTEASYFARCPECIMEGRVNGDNMDRYLRCENEGCDEPVAAVDIDAGETTCRICRLANVDPKPERMPCINHAECGGSITVDAWLKRKSYCKSCTLKRSAEKAESKRCASCVAADSAKASAA